MNNNFIKVLVVFTFMVMIIVNVLANSLPINGISTSVISDNYANLFTPTGMTFSIWGLIYVLLAIYVFYQLTKDRLLLNKIGIYFSISSVANALWIFCWHYDLILFSLILMFVILFSLIKINTLIKKEELDKKEKFFISLPFNVYLGWITVASIANTIVFLITLGFNGFSVIPIIGFLLLGAVLGSLGIFKTRSIAYGLVLIWAYLGILIKHFSLEGFSGQYLSIIIVTIISIIIFIFSCFRLKKSL
ncbi:MAG: tryptophan-rich sensory protein [Candidatus Pacebacteria bacterium]|nr:tryptophan-rich sensory protein [Candidatus Paceibacterota bacterium]